MTVRPIAFNPNGSIEVTHDGPNHVGTIAKADIGFAKTISGADDIRFIELACPVPGCNAVSVHPVSGGCDPVNVQKMFGKKFRAAPVTVPGHPNAQRNWTQAKSLVQELAEAMDGPGRFRLEGVDEE